VRAVLLPVGDDWCALEMSTVGEVVAAPAPTVVPTAPSAVLGLFNLRGDVLPLFDTGLLLGLAAIGVGPFCAVVLTSLGAAGIVTTGQPEVTDLEEQLTGPEGPASLGGYAVGTRLVNLLDAEQLLSQERIGGPR
jgi:purine-binding chemotaxis protein CheW